MDNLDIDEAIEFFKEYTKAQLDQDAEKVEQLLDNRELSVQTLRVIIIVLFKESNDPYIKGMLSTILNSYQVLNSNQFNGLFALLAMQLVSKARAETNKEKDKQNIISILTSVQANPNTP